jgi:hypothetical protein
MGYPDIAIEQKLTQLRKYGEKNTQCWSNKVSDRKLTDLLSHFINVSKMQKQECKNNGIPFFDSSNDFETTFIKAKEYTISNINHA